MYSTQQRPPRIVIPVVMLLVLSQATARAVVVINELMASNSIFTDQQGQTDDWIEIHNDSASAVDIGGWYLTDDVTDPMKWRIPEDRPELTLVRAEGFLLIWADGDTQDSGLHADFSLRADGETVALVAEDGTTLLDSVMFPAQKTDVSYGRDPNLPQEWIFMDQPTPDSANQGGYEGWVADTQFSIDRGFYDDPITVEITTETPGATIMYSLDGTDPRFDPPYYDSRTKYTGHVKYTEPIVIDTTTCLRAYAFKPGFLSSNVDTQTYIFIDDVIRQDQQQAIDAGYPSTWTGYGADYSMDPEITLNPDYADDMPEALLSLPTVSIVMDKDDLFHRNVGMYTHPESEGKNLEWERPASVELFSPDGDLEFQVNCGLRLQGGHSRKPEKSPKHSFSLRFRNIYGPGRLNYPVFGENWPVDSFDTLHLRAGFNNAWIHHQASQCRPAQYIRDQWMRDSLTAMGHPDALQGRYVHLYINGFYWGLYILHERPDADHYVAYHGGDPNRVDAINGDPTYVISDPLNTGSVSDGNDEAWRELIDTVKDQDWARISQLLDVDSFIDWTILFHFAGTTDIKRGTNWRAAGGGPDRRPWRFYSWDMEHVMENLFQQWVGTEPDPSGLFEDLRSIEEFRIRFGDRVHKHLFNNGALGTERNLLRWLNRSDQIDMAIIAESARWGDYRRDVYPASNFFELYTKNDHWLLEKNEIVNNYFPNRNPIALQMFKSMGLYPDVDAPTFYVNGTYQHGGHVDPSASLTMESPSGTIYYTLDGTDPRFVNSAQNEDLIVLISDTAPKRVLVPTGEIGSDWFSQPDYNDTDWVPTSGGVGFELGRDYNPFIELDLLDILWGVNAGCYIRIPFDVNDASTLQQLLLKIRFDDGFAAYLNGQLVVQQNVPESLAWNSNATFAHEASEAFTTIDLSSFLNTLQSGKNLLAIHGLNASVTSTDFLISVELLASTDAQQSQGQYSSPISINQSLHVKARAYENGQWSALNEATYSVNSVAQSLRITELMYHPINPDAEFIELVNIGLDILNLNLVQFTDGIDFIFDDMDLAPDDRVVIVRDLAMFTDEYGPDIPVAGQYSGSLNNAGERLTLVDAAGAVIQDFEYQDNWYPATDGLGYSLNIIDPAGDPNTWSDKAAWTLSPTLGGSPGQ